MIPVSDAIDTLNAAGGNVHRLMEICLYDLQQKDSGRGGLGVELEQGIKYDPNKSRSRGHVQVRTVVGEFKTNPGRDFPRHTMAR